MERRTGDSTFYWATDSRLGRATHLWMNLQNEDGLMRPEGCGLLRQSTAARGCLGFASTERSEEFSLEGRVGGGGDRGWRRFFGAFGCWLGLWGCGSPELCGEGTEAGSFGQFANARGIGGRDECVYRKRQWEIEVEANHLAIAADGFPVIAQFEAHFFREI
jgi:hypothetical protein